VEVHQTARSNKPTANQRLGLSERVRLCRSSDQVTIRAASSSHSLRRVARSPSASEIFGTL
jgi:hypothetical protein